MNLKVSHLVKRLLSSKVISTQTNLQKMTLEFVTEGKLHFHPCLTLYQSTNFFDHTRLKAVADKKVNVIQKLDFVFGKSGKHCGKTSIFSFSHIVFKPIEETIHHLNNIYFVV